MAPRKAANNNKESTHTTAKSNGEQPEVMALADELIRDISSKSSVMKKAIKTLDAEKARLEQEFKAKVREIEKHRGRLNAFLVRLGGGAVVERELSDGSSSGRSKRMSSQESQELEVKILELASQHKDVGLKRGDVVEAFGMTAPQASRILHELEATDRLAATGQKAGRRYFAR